MVVGSDCAGHLLEGAIAYYRATGRRLQLDTLCRYGDHIATVLGRGPGQKRGYCGHPRSSSRRSSWSPRWARRRCAS